MVQVHQLDPYCVQEIRVLERKPQSDKAREMLESVAKQVQPILRRRQFNVPLLREFYPSNAGLLGLNTGGGGGGTQEICVRLRPAGRDADFFPYEHVLGTMLHEITHNVVGPHNAAFYKLLDELTKECEELIAKGISGTGAGFDAPAAGKAGGRFVGRELPAYRVRELALQAAEQRLKKQAVMPSGPRIAGGDLSLRHLPPREAAAAAAERRLRDNVWCPTEAIGQEAAAGHNVDAALQAILNNSSAPPEASGAPPSGNGGVDQELQARLPQHQQGPAPQQQQQQQQHQQEQQQQPQQQQAPIGGSAAAAAAAAAAPRAPRVGGPGPRAGMGLRDRLARALAKGEAASARANGGAGMEVQEAQAEPAGVAAPRQPPDAGQAQQQQQQPQQQQQQRVKPQPKQASMSGVVDLTLSSDEEGEAQQSRAQAADGQPPQGRGAHQQEQHQQRQEQAGQADPEEQRSKRASLPWTCPACTLSNTALALVCEACLSVRPVRWGT